MRSTFRRRQRRAPRRAFARRTFERPTLSCSSETVVRSMFGGVSRTGARTLGHFRAPKRPIDQRSRVLRRRSCVQRLGGVNAALRGGFRPPNVRTTHALVFFGDGRAFNVWRRKPHRSAHFRAPKRPIDQRSRVLPARSCAQRLGGVNAALRGGFRPPNDRTTQRSRVLRRRSCVQCLAA